MTTTGNNIIYYLQQFFDMIQKSHFLNEMKSLVFCKAKWLPEKKIGSTWVLCLHYTRLILLYLGWSCSNNLSFSLSTGQINLSVEFKSRFLRPAEAMLILVGHRVGSASGTTMVFRLVSQIDDVTPMVRY